MRIVMFYHSLLSDWNHGNAHFLRGIVSELLSRGHSVSVYEPKDSWSFKNLVSSYGYGSIRQLLSVYPWLRSVRYEMDSLDLDSALDGADLVIVHEWNDHGLVKKIGEKRRTSGFKLLFHDTHHRSVTEPENMSAYDLSNYDGVLAFGEVIKDIYLTRSWAQKAWVWHEAADVKVFSPRGRPDEPDNDLVWIGNWGDEERSEEIREFIIGPVQDLGLKARMHGVRYPEHALAALDEAGIQYKGWLPNFAVPQVFASAKATVHVPRRPYAKALPGIPTIRVFEALACGIPLVTAPWDDSEGLFDPGGDYLTVRSGSEMKMILSELLNDKDMREELSRNGRDTILKRHTCRHRADELLNIYSTLECGAEERVTV